MITNPLSLDFLNQKPERAAAILQTLADQQAADYLAQVPSRTLVRVIDCMEHWPAARILECMPTEQNAAIISRLDYQSAVALLRLHSADRCEQLLDNLPGQLVRALRRSLAYPDNTVGAWTDNATPQFATTTSAGECLALLQKMPQAAGTALVITDSQYRVLGLLALDQLLISSPQTLLGDLADRNIQPLDAQMSLAVAGEAAGWYRYTSLPVRTSQGIYMGSITREQWQNALQRLRPAPSTTVDNSLTAHLSRAMLTAVSGMLSLLSFEVLTLLTGQENHDSER